MSEHISAAIERADINSAQPAGADAAKAVRSLFMLFHGMYGNLFLSRYATGELDAEGKDKGVKSAMVIWQSDLARFDAAVVRAAAERCKTDHQKFPPTLPEFLALCRALQPRAAHFDKPGAIEMSAGLKSSYTAKARAKAMATYRAKLDSDVGLVRVGSGLSGLCQLVASAVGLAGGDEVAALSGMERLTVAGGTK
jgi:hypothetical protein